MFKKTQEAPKRAYEAPKSPLGLDFQGNWKGSGRARDGFEVEVVRGGLNFLKQQQPIIIMELAPYTLDERGSSLEQLLKMLSSVGYVLCSQDNGHELPASSSELRAFIPDGGSINVIARAN